nr:pyridoxamine 5'-phosphate oxidase family protein [uncultured Anaerosporobacter sp.]
MEHERNYERMRRRDREVKNPEEILAIMRQCDVCNVAFFDTEYPYVIPLNFGVEYENEEFTMYFHSSIAGKKLDLLQENNKVAFSMSCSHNLVTGDLACDCTMEFESVCGNGTIEILGEEEKMPALTKLMNHYQPGIEHKYDERLFKVVSVLKLNVNEIYGKRLKKKSM